MLSQSKIQSVRIQGYRPFRDFSAHFDALEVLVGANGSGKSSLFEFLKFLRDGVHADIPPEIIAGSIGQQIFHVPGPQRFAWRLDIDTGIKTEETGEANLLRYQGELMGPVGRFQMVLEQAQMTKPFANQKVPYRFMNIRARQGTIQEPSLKRYAKQKMEVPRPNQLALSTISNPMMVTLYNLREYIRNWRFYSSFNLANDKIRKSVPIEQEPVLHEDAGNLSSVLHFLMTEHPSRFDDLQQYLRTAIPGFKSLTVKARGGPGEVIAFCQEEGVGNELSLADLSDGVLRLICWMVLCVHPHPPALICIDEPDQGVHPRTLPLLAGLFEKACQKTQLFLATHASYFLMQFDISRVAVFRKENGETVFRKPKNSKTLCDNLSDFGQEEIEIMHKSDELEKIG